MRSQYAKPGAPRSLIPDAILVAPATYNTINKWAQGITDTYALGILAEAIVVLPFVSTALAGRAPFRRSVESLRAEGVRILLGPGGFQPHPPRTGGNLIDGYPWHLGLDEAERMLDLAPPKPSSTGGQGAVSAVAPARYIAKGLRGVGWCAGSGRVYDLQTVVVSGLLPHSRGPEVTGTGR